MRQSPLTCDVSKSNKMLNNLKPTSATEVVNIVTKQECILRGLSGSSVCDTCSGLKGSFQAVLCVIVIRHCLLGPKSVPLENKLLYTSVKFCDFARVICNCFLTFWGTGSKDKATTDELGRVQSHDAAVQVMD